MNFIYFNKGALWVLGSAAITAAILSNAYKGENGSLIILQVMSYTCACLELSKHSKPRINDIFPIIFLILPAGGYFTFVKRGVLELFIYIIALGLIYSIAQRRSRRRAEQSG